MKVEIHGAKGRLPTELRSGVRRRLRLAIGSQARWVRQIRVRVLAPDPGAGRDQHACRVEVVGHAAWNVAAVERGDNVLVAVDCAARRAARAAARVLDWFQDFRPGAPRRQHREEGRHAVPAL